MRLGDRRPLRLVVGLAAGAGAGYWSASAVWAPGARITASTIVGNSTPLGASALGGDQMQVTGSIVSDAVAACGAWVLVDSTFDLVSDATCGLPAAPSALLGPLADNGGPTLTHLPGLGSPAIDAIPAGTAGLCDRTLATDQRGAVRPQGTACDIGSVER